MTILDQKYYYETYANDENNYSVCTLFTFGKESFLFTGDLEYEGEESLVELNDLSKVTMFKAAHHGSNSSNRANLMSVIQPEIVVIPCIAGSDEHTGNRSGQFPTQNTINNIAPYTEKVYITGLCTDEDDDLFTSFYGDIIVSSNGKQTTVTFSNEEYLRSDGTVIELKYTEWFNNFRKMPTEWAIG
jgi:competence protein ComEC